MKITAKVRCNSRTPAPDGTQDDVVFGADYKDADGNLVNTDWARWTPGLSIYMSVRHEVPFEPGTSYTLTFDDGQE